MVQSFRTFGVNSFSPSVVDSDSRCSRWDGRALVDPSRLLNGTGGIRRIGNDHRAAAAMAFEILGILRIDSMWNVAPSALVH
jgi:hypothetical protein